MKIVKIYKLRDGLDFFNTAGQSLLQQNWQEQFDGALTVDFTGVDVNHFDADLNAQIIHYISVN